MPDHANSAAATTSAPTIAEVIKQVRDEARRRGVRWTNQRQVIVDTFISSNTHLTAEDLHSRVKSIDPTVSAATVYRTINMLVEIGVAQKRNFGTTSSSFEPAVTKEHHDHLICLSCAEITEFHLDAIELLQEQVAKQHGFQLVNHRLELYGLCQRCRERGAQIPNARPAKAE